MAAAPDLQDVIRAQGVALALIATLLERDGLMEPGEFGRQLAVLATVTHEESERQGEILGAWAALAIDAAEACQPASSSNSASLK